MMRKKLIISGKVQGVGFRFFVKLKSLSFNVTGFAKNLDNGNVLVEIQGEELYIKKIIESLYIGNGFCKVEDIIQSNIEILSSEKKFNIY